MFRNERNLYWRTCDLCGKRMISMFAPDKPYTVYCNPCWWSDKWDAGVYVRDYDPNRNFFDQFKDLQLVMPYMNLSVGYASLENCDYVNHAAFSKNCYLMFVADYCENVHYSTQLAHDKDSMDCLDLGESELCYEDIVCGKCFNVFFSEDCHGCNDVYFSKNLVGCNHCFGCVNLRNVKYHMFNEPHTKEEYERKLKEIRLDSYASIVDLRQKSREFWKKSPHKFMHGHHNTGVSGDYVYYSKNAHDCYRSRYVEDSRWCQNLTLQSTKDSYDYTEWGNGAEQIYDSVAIGEGVNNIRFSSGVWDTCLDVEYSTWIISSSHIFGSVGLRKKQYHILNKRYSKEDYEKLRAQIIQDMNEKPYVDSKGRVWKYGEFLPSDLSVFAYNESTANEYYPHTKDEILERGWQWYEAKPPEHKISIKTENVPDSITDVQDSILTETLECGECRRAFRIIKDELGLLRRFGLPIPRQCPACRHRERFSRLNPPRLWDRQCAKCGAPIRTSYAPDRPEIVYCEQCYLAEVA